MATKKDKKCVTIKEENNSVTIIENINKIENINNAVANENRNNDSICCIIGGIFFTIVIAIILFAIIGTILFPILASKTQCGFKIKDTIVTHEYEGTVINSTIDSYTRNNYDKGQYYYECFNIIYIGDLNVLCDVMVYSGENIRICNDNIYPNYKKILIFFDDFDKKCYLTNPARNCDKSNTYTILGIIAIIILCVLLIVLLFNC